MKVNERYIRAAAVCAIIAAATTLLVAIPFSGSEPMKVSERITFYTSPLYGRLAWVGLGHVCLLAFAYIAVAFVLIQRSPLLAGLGALCFILWAAVSLILESSQLYVLSDEWSKRYFTDRTLRGSIATHLTVFESIWGSIGCARTICIALGSLCFGLASWRSLGLQKAVAVLLVSVLPVAVAGLAATYMWSPRAGDLVSWVYAFLQSATRFLMGLWLYRLRVSIRTMLT